MQKMHALSFLKQQNVMEQKNVSDRIPLRQCQHQMLLGVCLCCAGLNAPVKLITLDLFNKTSLMPFSTRGISDTWTIVDSMKILWILGTLKNVPNGILRWRYLRGGLLSKHRKIFSTPRQPKMGKSMGSGGVWLFIVHCVWFFSRNFEIRN